MFRSLKSELGLRPMFHHKKDRVRGHLFISVLAYHIVHTIRFELKASDIHRSWASLRRRLFDCLVEAANFERKMREI